MVYNDIASAAIGFVLGAAIAMTATFLFCMRMMRWCVRYAVRYRLAFKIMCRRYRKITNCRGCKYNGRWQNGGCEISPRYPSAIDDCICGAVVKKIVEDRVEKAGIE